MLILKIFHIAFAAPWFGGTLSTVGDIRRTIALGAPHLGPLHARLRRIGLIARISGLATLLSGVGLIFYFGGFAKVATRFHIALGLTILSAVVGVVIAKTTDSLIAQGESADQATLQPLAKRIAMFSGIFQLLWFVNLCIMVIASL